MADFLLARIAEDEAGNGCNGEGEYATCWQRSERIERECEAKRRIVKRAVTAKEAADAWTTERLCVDTRSPAAEWARDGAYREVLRDLALPYADHPDYREEWKP